MGISIALKIASERFRNLCRGPDWIRVEGALWRAEHTHLPSYLESWRKTLWKKFIMICRQQNMKTMHNEEENKRNSAQILASGRKRWLEKGEEFCHWGEKWRGRKRKRWSTWDQSSDLESEIWICILLVESLHITLQINIF